MSKHFALSPRELRRATPGMVANHVEFAAELTADELRALLVNYGKALADVRRELHRLSDAMALAAEAAGRVSA